MEYKLNHETCILCGDIHGGTKRFFDSVKEHGNFENSDIIILGDVGLGFYAYCDEESLKDRAWMMKINDWAKENGNDVWVFRGNHDNPAMYAPDADFWNWFDCVHCLRDGDIVTDSKGNRYLIVPGGISVDRSGMHRIRNMSYWRDEPVRSEVYQAMKEQKFHGIFAHTGPTPPDCAKSSFLAKWEYREEEIYREGPDCFPFDNVLPDEIKKEREEVDFIISKFKPRYWFNGHYHEDAHFEYLNTEVFTLGICQFLNLNTVERG